MQTIEKYLDYIQEAKNIKINFLGKYKVDVMFNSLKRDEIKKVIYKIEKKYNEILKKIRKDINIDVKKATKSKMSMDKFIESLKPIFIRFQDGEETYSIDLIFDCGKVFGNHVINVQLDKNLNIDDAYIGIEG